MVRADTCHAAEDGGSGKCPHRRLPALLKNGRLGERGREGGDISLRLSLGRYLHEGVYRFNRVASR